jgi:hypothetical protein
MIRSKPSRFRVCCAERNLPPLSSASEICLFRRRYYRSISSSLPISSSRNFSSQAFKSLNEWKNEPPCHEEIFLNAKLSFLIYWLSYHRNYDLGMKKLRELSCADHRKYEKILSVPRIGGFLAAPGPKTATEVQWLLLALKDGFDEDAFVVDWDDTLNAMLILEPTRDRLTVVLRGSASIRDLVVNATVIPWNASPSDGIRLGKVHLGFWNRVKSSRETIHKMASLNPKNVRITGHSMGAALGVLVASHLPFIGCNARIEVITFGGPRIGNEAFCRGFNELPTVRHYRQFIFKFTLLNDSTSHIHHLL